MNHNEDSLDIVTQPNSKDVEMPEMQIVETEDLIDSSMRLLNPKQQRFIHLYLTGAYKLQELADLLHMSIYGVKKWLRTPNIRQIIDKCQAEEDEVVKQGLKALKLKAMYKMSELIDSPMDAIAYQAARDILDRGGHKPPTKNETKVEIYSFEQQLKDAIGQSGKLDDFIEADFSKVEE